MFLNPPYHKAKLRKKLLHLLRALLASEVIPVSFFQARFAALAASWFGWAPYGARD